MIYSFVNEERVLKNLLNNKKSININPTQKIILYIKHLKQKEKTKAEIRDLVDELMESHYKGFVMADWDKKLKSLVNKYSKKEYMDFKIANDVNVTINELEFIKKLQDIELEKLLFIMLVVAKSNPNIHIDKIEDTKEFWVNCDSKELFSLSGYKYKKNVDRFKQREYFIYDIKEKGLIDVKKVVDSNGIKLLYCDNTYDEKGLTIKIDEDTVDSLVLYYLRWRGEKIIECSICGKLVEVIGKSPVKYCKKCSEIERLRRQKEYMKK